MTELVHISVGELWDKYTILLIKKEKITDKNKLQHINLEIKFLDENMKKYQYNKNKLFIDLKIINEQLWDIENNIRKKEYRKEFDSDFIEFARSVYITNDKRSFLKKEINIYYDAPFNEVKDYTDYN